jgi:signal peptidase II
VTVERSNYKTRDMRWWMIVIAAVVIALDRWSKDWIKAHIHAGAAITVVPHVFRLTHVLNTGAAFSMFEGANHPEFVRYALIGFSLVAVIVVLAFLWKIGGELSITSVSLALILGGAIGNLYDRMHYSFVIDFLEVHIGSYHWPDFNLADSAIVIGACLLIFEMLRGEQ